MSFFGFEAPRRRRRRRRFGGLTGAPEVHSAKGTAYAATARSVVESAKRLSAAGDCKGAMKDMFSASQFVAMARENMADAGMAPDRELERLVNDSWESVSSSCLTAARQASELISSRALLRKTAARGFVGRQARAAPSAGGAPREKGESRRVIAAELTPKGRVYVDYISQLLGRPVGPGDTVPYGIQSQVAKRYGVKPSTVADRIFLPRK